MKKLNKKVFLTAALIAFALIAVRIAVLYPTFDKLKIETFRVGITPVNDGADWVERALFILENKKIGMRPMFSAFLALAIAVIGMKTAYLIILLVLLDVGAVLLAFYILRHKRNNIFIVAFLSFVSIWRIGFLGDMMTENLALPFIIVGFALVLRALFDMSFAHLVLGIFFTGVAQAIRPWDFICILTLSLIPIVCVKASKKNFALSAVVLAVFSAGFSFSVTSSKFYSELTQDKIDKANYVYGQAAGGNGCNFWITNRNIKRGTLDYILKKISADDLTRIIFDESFRLLKEKPLLFFGGLLRTTKYYFILSFPVYDPRIISLPYFFLFFFFFLYALFDRPKDIIASYRASPKINKLIVALLVIVFLLNGKYWLMFSLTALGLIFLFIYPEKRQKGFILLYLAGIYLSVLAMGAGGSGRMWISQELVFYYLAAFAIGVLLFNFKYPLGHDSPKGDLTVDIPLSVKWTLTAFVMSALFFLVLPGAASGIKKYSSTDINTPFTAKTIAKDLNINEEIIPQNIIEWNIIAWPQPTFEKLSGSWAYWVLKYRDYKAFELAANDGIKDRYWQYSKWHMFPMPFPRVVFDDRNPIIFPYLKRSDLKRFDNEEIILVGKLLGKKRLLYTHLGFAIVAEYIGHPDDNGKLTWIKVKDLATN